MNIKLPQEVEKIISILTTHGYEAYAVGGCVRDSILGRTPEDWDITTSAKPQEVKKLFDKTIDTGIEHGTVTVRMHGKGYEVTTYRIDGDYSDGRHPDEVIYTASLIEDLKRRDFTVNAMAYSTETGLVDEFHGMDDLNAKLIRCVGDAHDRFSEDALRILRAIRFCAQLDFTMTDNTRQSVVDLAANLEHVSKERIYTELNKLLMSDHPECAMEISRAHIDTYLTNAFPLIYKSYKEYALSQSDTDADKVLVEDMKRAAKLPKDRYIRWAAWCSHMYQEDIRKVLKELKADNDTIEKSSTLVREIGRPLSDKKKDIRRTLHRIGSELYDDMIVLKRHGFGYAEDKTYIETVAEEKFNIIADKDCYELKNLAMTGNDLIELGIKPGPEIGRILNSLLEKVIDNPEYNEYKKLKGLIE